MVLSLVLASCAITTEEEEEEEEGGPPVSGKWRKTKWGQPVYAPEVWHPWVQGYMGEMWYGQWNFQYFSRMWIDQELKKSQGY